MVRALTILVLMGVIAALDAFALHPRLPKAPLATLSARRHRRVTVREASDKPSLEETDPSLAALYAELGLSDEQRLEGDRDEEPKPAAEAEETVGQQGASGGGDGGSSGGGGEAAAEKQDIARYDRLAKGLQLKANANVSAGKSKAAMMKNAKTAESMRSALEYKVGKTNEGRQDAGAGPKEPDDAR